MLVTKEDAELEPQGDTALVVISSDSHVSPRIDELEPYCPRQHVASLVEYMRANQGDGSMQGESPGRRRRQDLNDRTAGHYDMKARVEDMNDDGIAAEVMFHGSFSRDPFPFKFAGLDGVRYLRARSETEAELALVGIQTYNRWLAAACETAPGRLVGLAHLPDWDIDACRREIAAVKALGIRAVNWPSMAGLDGPQYDSPEWDPVWAAFVDGGIVPNTHGGAVIPGFNAHLPHSLALAQQEAGGWPSRRGMLRMVFGGAFERFPDLKLVLTEQPGTWFKDTQRDLDSSWLSAPPAIREALPLRPSEYLTRNVYVGASFMAPFEAADAVESGYAKQLMWGRDYPHREGTWAFRESPDEPNRTKLSLRRTFRGLSASDTAAMIGGTACRIYGLDPHQLRRIAEDIAAPTLNELNSSFSDEEQRAIETALDQRFDFTSGFRSFGPWA